MFDGVQPRLHGLLVLLVLLCQALLKLLLLLLHVLHELVLALCQHGAHLCC